MTSIIDGAVHQIVGLNLWDYGEALDLKKFAFGTARSVIATRGPLKGQQYLVPEFQLHLLTPWHLESNGSLILESGAHLLEGSGEDIRPNGVAQYAMRRLMEANSYHVISTYAVGEGGAIIQMDKNLSLQIDTPPINGAEWLLFEPGTTRPAFRVIRSTDDSGGSTLKTYWFTPTTRRTGS